MEDYILNGVGHGAVANALLQHHGDSGVLRPFIGNDGRSYISVRNSDGSRKSVLTQNAATLRKDEWKLLDSAVLKIARNRLRLVGDILNDGLVYNIPNGMGTTVFQTETQSDVEDASISMDGVREGERDRPEYGITSLPLPIIHKDFSFSTRQIQTSRNGTSPLDLTSVEMSARKVAERIEKLTVGTSTYTYGGGTIYGITNHPSRMTYTLTAPTASGWTGSTLLNQLLAMRELAKAQNHFGPYRIYTSTAWDQYLDNDFKAASDKSLRQRLLEVDDFTDIRTVDNMSNFDIVMVQMTPDVIRMVNALGMTTLQWESHGGMQLNFKVMAIQVPQVRIDFASQGGIVHGSTA
jgi:hypothetical protein